MYMRYKMLPIMLASLGIQLTATAAQLGLVKVDIPLEPAHKQGKIFELPESVAG